MCSFFLLHSNITCDLSIASYQQNTQCNSSLPSCRIKTATYGKTNNIAFYFLITSTIIACMYKQNPCAITQPTHYYCSFQSKAKINAG